MWNNPINPSVYWTRAIILVDMNAFFASIEQFDSPALRGRAVAVTNGKEGTCIITASYEARSYGIKTGMRFYEAKRLCPHLIQVPARPKRYVEVSRAIMNALGALTPDIEIFSVDEAFLDVTHCQLLFGTPEQIARIAKKRVFEASGLHCSIGVSGDKTTAKFAAKLQKPNGLTVIPPWESGNRLKYVPVTELCGIKKGVGSFLAKHGVLYCGDMEKLPISILAKRFGNVGKRIWYMCQGRDPEPVHTKISDPKSMGHGKVMPPNTKEETIVETYLMHMCEKLASRLRSHHFQAQRFFAGVHNKEIGWLGTTGQTMRPTDDGKEIFQLSLFLLHQAWLGEPVWKIQVTALNPRSGGHQLDLFAQENNKRNTINHVLDEINDRYGEFTIAPATLLERSKMPNVIAPAWKPTGHRQTI